MPNSLPWAYCLYFVAEPWRENRDCLESSYIISAVSLYLLSGVTNPRQCFHCSSFSADSSGALLRSRICARLGFTRHLQGCLLVFLSFLISICGRLPRHGWCASRSF